MSTPLSGRKAQAARNDEAILVAARTVFLRSPDAPISAVAQEAGVGMSALYRRFAGKEDLLVTLCADGLRRFIAVAERAERLPDAGEAFTAFVEGVVEEDTHALTVHLAGTFTPTPELRDLARQAGDLGDAIFARALAAGAVRADLVTEDVAMIFEQVTAVRVDDPERTRVLRSRYLALLLDAVRPGARTGALPGPGPTAAELGARWVPR